MKLLILSGGYHPYHQTTPVLEQFLRAAGHEANSTDDPACLTDKAALQAYDGIVFNTRREAVPTQPKDLTLEPDEREGLQNFIASGKAFICLHVSTCAPAAWPQFHEITGGGWVSGTSFHPPYTEFAVRVSDPNHPCIEGVRDFKTHDELYMNLAMLPGNEIFLTADASDGTYPYGPERRPTFMPGGTYPMAWTRRYGEGKVFVLLLGHDTRSFQNESFQRLVLNGVQWATVR